MVKKEFQSYVSMDGQNSIIFRSEEFNISSSISINRDSFAGTCAVH